MKHLRRLALLLLLPCCALHGHTARGRSPAEDRVAWDAEVARLASLTTALSTDFDKTTYLRQYTGMLLDVGRPDARVDARYISPSFDSFDPAEYYPLFKADRVPALCGVTSIFYIKLLQRLGFKAYQYSFGFTTPPDDRFIHSVTLVEIAVGGRKRLIVQDPFLNVTYRTTNGDPFDFYELLAALKKKQYDRIVMDAASVETAFVARDLSLFPDLSEPCRAMMLTALTRPDGSIGTTLPITRNYATMMQSPCGAFEEAFVEALRRNGYPEPLMYAYTLRASEMVGAADHAQIQQQIDRILR